MELKIVVYLAVFGLLSSGESLADCSHPMKEPITRTELSTTVNSYEEGSALCVDRKTEYCDECTPGFIHECKSGTWQPVKRLKCADITNESNSARADQTDARGEARNGGYGSADSEPLSIDRVVAESYLACDSGITASVSEIQAALPGIYQQALSKQGWPIPTNANEVVAHFSKYRDLAKKNVAQYEAEGANTMVNFWRGEFEKRQCIVSELRRTM